MSSPESLRMPEQAPSIQNFKQESLALLRDMTQQEPYPGYPAQDKRLHSPVGDLFNYPMIPSGPWWVNEADMSDETPSFMPHPGDVDSRHRPLHPWFWDMVQDPSIGVVAGKGAYWDWKANQTADPVIIRRDLDEPHVLLIKREDTGIWALPGGFVNKGETGVDAAIREGWEETGGEDKGVNLTGLDYKATVLYQGPVVDPRMTAHAWPETTAVRFELSDESAAKFTTMRYDGTDDAREVWWAPASELEKVQLFGSHPLFVAEALRG